MANTADHFISPKYKASKASPGTFVDWVDIYEDRMWGWHLQYAHELRHRGRDAAIAALHLAVAFIEPYEVFWTGESSLNKSREFFCKGFQRIFGQHQTTLSADHFELVTEAIYEQIRCGLVHGAMTGNIVYLSNTQQGMEAQIDPATNSVRQIVLDPGSFVDGVISEFHRYVERLRDPTDPEHAELKKTFEAAWHLVHRRAA